MNFYRQSLATRTWARRLFGKEGRCFLRLFVSSGATYLFLVTALAALLLALWLRPPLRVAMGEVDQSGLLAGFHEPEVAGGRSYRWTWGHAVVRFPAPGLSGPHSLVLRAAAPQGPTMLDITVDGWGVTPIQVDAAPATYRLSLNLPAGTAARTIRVELASTTFRPADDPRDLGVEVEWVQLVGGRPTLPALPWGELLLLLLIVLVGYAAMLRLTLRPLVALILMLPLLLLAARGAQRAWLLLILRLPYWAGLIGAAALFLFLFASAIRRGVGALWRVCGRIQGPVRAVPGGRLARPAALLWTVRLGALAVLALHLLAPLLPLETGPYESYAWGVRFFAHLPWLWRVALVMAGAAGVLAAAPLARLLVRLARRVRPHRLNAWLGVVLVGGLSPVVFWLLRTRCFYGDWQEVLEAIAAGQPWRERSLLALALRFFVGRLLVAHWPVWMSTLKPQVECLTVPVAVENPVGPVLAAQALISCLAGGVFVVAVILLGRALLRPAPERILFGLLVVAQGTLLLFCGYVELYSLVTAATMGYLLLGVLALQGRVHVIWPAVALLLALGFHLEAGYLAPSYLLLLAWRWREQGWGWTGGLKRLGKMAMGGLSLLAIASLALLLAGYDLARLTEAGASLGGTDHLLFKHLLWARPNSREVYPILSWAHLWAVLNQQLLVAPLSLWVGGGVALFQRWTRKRMDPCLLFFLVAALAALLFMCTYNPDLGPRNDWDLFVSPGVALTVASAYLLLGRTRPASTRLAAGVAWLALSLAHAGGWVLFNYLG